MLYPAETIVLGDSLVTILIVVLIVLAILYLARRIFP